jgi:hypothetical protein
MTDPGRLQTLVRAAELVDDEAQVRELARHAELYPERAEEARQLFGMANGLRKARLALLERCGLR